MTADERVAPETQSPGPPIEIETAVTLEAHGESGDRDGDEISLATHTAANARAALRVALGALTEPVLSTDAPDRAWVRAIAGAAVT